ncbi:hypothetical protein Ancab_021113 [Ancistrocladus abbreviatus]
MGGKPWLLSSYIVLYSLWLHRNNIAFGRTVESKHLVFDRIQSRSFYWVAARLGLKGLLPPLGRQPPACHQQWCMKRWMCSGGLSRLRSSESPVGGPESYLNLCRWRSCSSLPEVFGDGSGLLEGVGDGACSGFGFLEAYNGVGCGGCRSFTGFVYLALVTALAGQGHMPLLLARFVALVWSLV